MGSDGSQTHKLLACPFNCQEPRLSPDGTTIAYVTLDATPDHRGSIATIRADGTAARQYTTSFEAYSAAWSPDATRFVVSEYGNGGGLWIVNVGDGAAHEIRNANSGSPSWSPDGARILFSDGLKLQTVTPTGANLQQVSKGTSGQYLAGHWSRDGHAIVFDFCCRNGKLEQVGAMNPDGTGEHFLTDGQFESYESTY